jgi:hypothetical protein
VRTVVAFISMNVVATLFRVRLHVLQPSERVAEVLVVATDAEAAIKPARELLKKSYKPQSKPHPIHVLQIEAVEGVHVIATKTKAR